MKFKYKKSFLSIITLCLCILLSACSANSTREPTNQPMPNPDGVWKNIAVPSNMAFPEFITSSNTKIAVAGIDNANSSQIWLCSTITRNCSLSNQNLADVEAITQLEFDAMGNLFGVFSIYQDSLSTIATTMVLPANGNTWQLFSSINGISLGLDTQSSLGILSSSAILVERPNTEIVSYGLATIHNHGNGESIIATATNFDSSNLNVVTDDSNGNLYVAGVNYFDNASLAESAPFSSVWTWNINAESSNQFKRINMPSDIPKITAMTSDNNGTIYIAGNDNEYIGHVWKYSNGIFSDTGLSASTITTLVYSPRGYLLAGGIDGINYNGQIWFYTQDAWTSLDLQQSSSVVSIATDAENNTIYATGNDNMNDPTIWIYQ